MENSKATGIQQFVKVRGIESLVHFTKVGNIPSILTHGLLGRKSLACHKLDAQINDQYRFDRASDAICASISFPNYKMFYGLQQSDAESDWAVLRLSPEVLWEIPCAFCITNAASNDVTCVPLEDRMELATLKSMFGDVPPDIKRENLGIPDSYTTNPQAEVLILTAVDPGFIMSVNVNAENKIKDMIAMKRLFKPYADKFKFLHDASLFTCRKDYKHWQRHQQLFDDIDIGFN